MSAEQVMVFGAFRLYRSRRLLCKGRSNVELGGRAFDVLTALVERAGQVVGNEELLALAWPHAVVGQACLRFQIQALRKALGEDARRPCIANIRSLGYSFVLPVQLQPLPPAQSPALLPAVTRVAARTAWPALAAGWA